MAIVVCLKALCLDWSWAMLLGTMLMGPYMKIILNNGYVRVTSRAR